MISKFKKFESKSNQRLEDELRDIFQKYLDKLNNESFTVKFNDDIIKISISNNTWVSGQTGLDYIKTISEMWSLLSNSLQMVCKLLNVELVDLRIIRDTVGCPISIKAFFSEIREVRDDEPKSITFNDIIEFSNRNGNPTQILIQIKNKIFTIGEVSHESRRNILYTHTDYVTLTTDELIDVIKTIDSSVDLKESEIIDEVEYTSSFNIDIKGGAIRNFAISPIWINISGKFAKPSNMVTGLEITNKKVREQIEEILYLKDVIVLVV